MCQYKYCRTDPSRSVMVDDLSVFTSTEEVYATASRHVAPVLTTFDVLTCPESMPNMQSQELRIIGRVVSFSADLDTGGQRRTCAFKGWVGHITKDTVTLIDAIRFDDVAELHAASTAGSDDEMERYPLTLHHDASGPSPVSVPPTAQPSNDGAHAAGRLPYATFPRRKLRNVKFETDYPLLAASRSQEIEPFLDAARSPAWFPHDAQKVRMFVRRYIVHTAQNNNDQQVSLITFLHSRISLPEGSMDAVILQTYVAEELADLATVDDEMVAHSTQGSHLSRQHDDGAQTAGVPTAAVTPPLIDANTLTLHTTYTAVGEFTCGIGLLLYSASVFTTEDVELVRGFLRQALSFCIAAGLVFVAASVCTAISIAGVRRSPMNIVKCGARMFTTLGAMGVGAATTASLVRFMFLTMKFAGTRFYDEYIDALAEDHSQVCELFRSYSCSGWATLCLANVTSADCPTPHCPSNFTVVCEHPVAEDIRHTLLPLLVMALAGALFALLDGIMFMRLRQRVQRSAGG
jgi:hypothetical protein